MRIKHSFGSGKQLAWMMGMLLALASTVDFAQTQRSQAELPSGDRQPIGFTGYLKDSESGLYYAGARYYDPAIGRFLTQDPVGGSPMNPPSLHRYLYAYANPTTYTDSTGRQVDIDDPERVARNAGLSEEQTAAAIAAHIGAEDFRSGAITGAGAEVARSAFGAAKWGARVLAKTFLDVGDAEAIVDPIVNGVDGVAEAIRRGPNGFVEYEARKSVAADKLLRRGRTVEAGELYGPEVATAIGGVATMGARANALASLSRASNAIEGIIVESDSGAAALRPAAPVAVATAGATIGPKIGRSGYESWAEFNAEAYRRYQQFADDAYDVALAAERDSLLPGNASTRIGDFVDRDTRFRMAEWLSREGIPEGPGNSVQLNRWLRNPDGSGEYVRPDVQLPGAIMDATVGHKTPNTPQIIRNAAYSGGKPTTIVRPSQLGGSCTVIPCSSAR